MPKSKNDIIQLLEQIELLTEKISIFLNDKLKFEEQSADNINTLVLNRKELLENLLKFIENDKEIAQTEEFQSLIEKIKLYDKQNLDIFENKLSVLSKKVKTVNTKKSLSIYSKK